MVEKLYDNYIVTEKQRDMLGSRAMKIYQKGVEKIRQNEIIKQPLIAYVGYNKRTNETEEDIAKIIEMVDCLSHHDGLESTCIDEEEEEITFYFCKPKRKTIEEIQEDGFVRQRKNKK